MRGFDRNVTGIGVLADPVRRRLYEFVCSSDQPVSRDHAAHAVGIARHKAKFHLDRLEAAGLLEADYVRLTGRSGPGAGRPAKRYRRGRKEFAVTLPARDYEFAGHIMADAISEATRTGAPITEAISKAASVRGAALAANADHPSEADGAVELVVRILSKRGYEPHRTDHAIVMANCPFHALAAEHTELVCRMNHSMLAAFVDAIAPGLLEASLEPAAKRCCVTLTARSGDVQMTETTS